MGELRGHDIKTRSYLQHGGLAADFLRLWDADSGADWVTMLDLVQDRDMRRVTTHDLPSMFT